MIESRQNDRFKTWISLLTSKGIKKHGLFLLFGEKVATEAKKDHADSIVESIRPDQTLSKELFAELDIFGTGSEILIMKVPSLSSWSPETSGSSLLLPLGDPSNLGTVIRSASAMGVDQIVLLEEAASPFHPKSVRAASGTLLKAKLYNGPSIQSLNTTSLFALDMEGENIAKVNWGENPKLLVGEEGPGVPKALDAKRVSIPMKNATESLNAATATAIALYEMNKKL